MKKSHALLVIALVMGAIVTAIIGNYMGLTRDSWPGWVQAIGSIAALGVAIFVMSQQNRHAAKLLLDADKRALLRRAASVKALVERAVLQMDVCCAELPLEYRGGTMSRIAAARLTAAMNIKGAKDALIAVPSHELGSYDMTTALQAIIECLSDLEVKISGGEISEVFNMGDAYAIILNESRDRAKRALVKFTAGIAGINVG